MIFNTFILSSILPLSVFPKMSAEEQQAAKSEFDNVVSQSQFKNIGDIVEKGEGDDEDLGPMSVESLCMNCHENVSRHRICSNVEPCGIAPNTNVNCFMTGSHPPASYPCPLLPRYHP